MKMKSVAGLFLAAVFLLTGCGNTAQQASSSSTSTESAITNSETEVQTVVVDTANMFTDRDMEIGYEEETSVLVTLTGTSATADSDAVQISNGKVIIAQAGTYILSGTLTDGMIVVNAGDTDKVQLVLNGVTITNSTSAAIYVLSADKVFVTTTADSVNTLSNGGEYVAIDDNNIDAVIFSKADLTLNGSGNLTILAAAGHGIVSKDDLVFTSGTYDITAANHGISGKDSVRIANGTYTIVAGKDGIHAENTDDTSLGFVYIKNGDFTITAQGDGISAGAYLQTEDGNYDIQSGGGSANAKVKTDAQNFGPGGMAQTQQTTQETTQDTTSTKGLKAGSDLIVNGGTFAIDSADDSVHTNGNLVVNAGVFEISSGDDGMHADSALTITGGSITIVKSYEGIEGLTIDIAGGEISLIASDDGLNAAGGADSSGFAGRGGDTFGQTDQAYIKIAGGTLHVNASGDGIDSNGNLYITGGETYVSGPSDSGNAALDYDGEASISGGTVIALGGSGMAQNFSTSSTQGAMLVNVNMGSAGDSIILCDSSGNQLISWQAEKSYSSVVISCPQIAQGSTYTLYTGDTTTEITMNSLIYGSGQGMGGGGMRGGAPGGEANKQWNGTGGMKGQPQTPPDNLNGTNQ